MKSNRSIIISIFVLIVMCFLINACTTRPRNVLTQEKLVDVFVDLYLADAVIRNQKAEFSNQEDKDALIASVLKKHGITQAELDSSLIWYADNSTQYQQIQDTASARLQRRKVFYDLKRDALYKFELSGFTTKLPEFYLLDINKPTLRFKIDSISLTTFGKDKFKFSFETNGVDTTINKLETKLYFKYKDSTVVVQKDIVEDSYYELTKPNIEDSLLIDISGYVHLKASSNKDSKVLLNNINNLNVSAETISDSIPKESKIE